MFDLDQSLALRGVALECDAPLGKRFSPVLRIGRAATPALAREVLFKIAALVTLNGKVKTQV